MEKAAGDQHAAYLQETADFSAGYGTTPHSYKSKLTSLSNAGILFSCHNRILRSVGNTVNILSELLQQQPEDSTP